MDVAQHLLWRHYIDSLSAPPPRTDFPRPWCYPLCFIWYISTVLPLMGFSWPQIKNDSFFYVSFDKNDSVTPYVFFPWWLMNNNSVTPYILFDKDKSVTPCVFFSWPPIKKGTVLPLMFFFMTTIEKQQCYPLCFIWQISTVLPLMFISWQYTIINHQ